MGRNVFEAFGQADDSYPCEAADEKMECQLQKPLNGRVS